MCQERPPLCRLGRGFSRFFIFCGLRPKTSLIQFKLGISPDTGPSEIVDFHIKIDCWHKRGKKWKNCDQGDIIYVKSGSENYSSIISEIPCNCSVVMRRVLHSLNV